MKVSGDATFPFKLYDMLEEADRKNFDCTVSWLPSGNSFKVHNVDEFVKKILPKYFGTQTRYRSFQRQLNLYAFQRCKTSGQGRGSYSHPLIQRGQRSQCSCIQRQTASRLSPKSLPSFPEKLSMDQSLFELDESAAVYPSREVQQDPDLSLLPSFHPLHDLSILEESSFDFELEKKLGVKHQLSLLQSSKRALRSELIEGALDVTDEIIRTFRRVAYSPMARCA